MDIYKEVTDRIIAELEKGIIPWEKPWIANGNCISHATGKAYSLLNQMLLGRPGEYVTFKQVQQEGGKVARMPQCTHRYRMYGFRTLRVQNDCLQ